jgi:alkylation response protein AidB-like acyl-CoA dehydrogenase
MVNFSLSPEQRALRSSVRDFAQDILSTAPRLYNHLTTQTTRFRSTLPIYRAAVSAGLVKSQVPTSCGGTSVSMLDAAILVEELYAVEPSTAITILGTGLGLTPLILAGNEEQRERLLAPFTRREGERLAAFVHSEPGGTANWLRKGSLGLQTTAYQDGYEWVVNGEKVSFLYAVWGRDSFFPWKGNSPNLLLGNILAVI